MPELVVPRLEQVPDFSISWPWQQSPFLLVGHSEDWVQEPARVSLDLPQRRVPLPELPLTKQLIFQVVELDWLVSPQLAVAE